MSPDPSRAPAEAKSLTPVIVVDAIEPCLPFWTERLGYTTVAEVPHGDGLGFVILRNGGVELMYQTVASVADDLPSVAAAMTPGTRITLFIEVSDLDAVERALAGVTVELPRRTTSYGMHEIGVREPGGTLVIFAQPGEKSAG